MKQALSSGKSFTREESTVRNSNRLLKRQGRKRVLKRNSLSPAVSLLLVFLLLASSVNAQGTKHLLGVKRKGAPVQLRGTLIKFDPEGQSMKVSWSLIDSTNTENSTFYSAGDKFSVVRQWNLYRDAKAIPGLRTPNTDIPVINLYDLYCVDDPTLAPIATLGQHKFDSVITEIEFTCSKENDAFSQPLFGYPLDVWTGSIVLVLTDRITAEQAHSSNCFVLGIRGAFIRGSILNWYISSIVINTCEDPDPDAGCEIHVKFVVRRSYIVKAIALIVVFIGWATTIVVLILTYKAAILQKSHAPTDVLAVCLASLLALPSLRAILPGVPSFGAIIDLIGIIPNVIVILSCAIFTVTKALH